MTHEELIENINRLNRLKTRLNKVLNTTAKNSVDFIFKNLNLQKEGSPPILLHIFYQSAIQQICVYFNQMNLGNYSIDILEAQIAAAEEEIIARNRERFIHHRPKKLRFSSSELQIKREENIKKPDNLIIEIDMQKGTNNSKKIKPELKTTEHATTARKKLIFN